MNKYFLIILFISGLLSCSHNVDDNKREITTNSEIIEETQSVKFVGFINKAGSSIKERFASPEGFQRESIDSLSFQHYLRYLPLKDHGEEVKYFNGDLKSNRNLYLAVVDLAIGKKDLHQCADAIMRLRAEYLYDQKRYDEIQFNLTNGFNVPYSKWMHGERVKVVGNKTTWVSQGAASNTYQDFWKYLEFIFTYAGTLSLDKELVPTQLNDMKIGSILIKGGSPGHAVIVVDMVVNDDTGEKKFMLAQSYMPAQEIQVLRNPANDDVNNPWYELTDFDILETPEWTFYSNQLKRFVEN